MLVVIFSKFFTKFQFIKCRSLGIDSHRTIWWTMS